MSLERSEQELVRRESLQKLKDLGINCYPADVCGYLFVLSIAVIQIDFNVAHCPISTKQVFFNFSVIF